MYTKEQLQAMSDFEANKALAIAQGRYAGDAGDWMPNGVKVSDESSFFYSEVDYCNSPNDIMPLAFEHGLSLVSLTDGYMASKCKTIFMEEAYRNMKFCDPSDMEFAHENPLRAIACCLILVLQERDA